MTNKQSWIIRISNQLLKEKEYDTVLYYLFNLTENNKENAEIYKIIGLCYFEKKDFYNAIEYFNKLLNENFENYNACRWLGNCYFNLEKYTKAIEYYNNSLTMDPNQDKDKVAYVLNSLGCCHLLLESYQESADCFKKAIVIDSNDSDSFFGLGECFFKQKKYREAIELYQKSLSIDLRNESIEIVETYCSLGWCYSELKNIKLALVYFKKGLEINPKNIDLYDGIGQIYFYDLSDYEKAYYYYKKAVELSNEKDEDYLFKLAYCQDHIKANDAAKETYSKLIKINPKYDYALYNLGILYRKSKNYIDAIRCFKQSIQINPRSKTGAIYNLAEIYEKLGEIKESIETWKLHTQNGIIRPKAKREIDRLMSSLGSEKNNSIDKTIENNRDYTFKSSFEAVKDNFDPVDFLIRENSSAKNLLSNNNVKSNYSFNQEYILEEEIAKKIKEGSLFNGELQIFKDQYGRDGRQYQTEIGIIDLLCINRTNNKLIVLELKRGKASDKVVGQISRYIGYVKKNIAKSNQDVEGVIILFKPDKKLEYAVAAHENIKILTYRTDIILE